MILLSDETIRKFLSKTIEFSDYEKQYNSLKKRVMLFINKLRSRVFKKKQIIKRFIKNIKYKKLIKNNPCNESDLYTTEKYDKNNKNNIYLIDVKLNKKWWFSIETITKLLCNNLSQFDGETYDIICKMPINPYTNKSLTLGQLTSVYDQLNKKTNVQKIIVLFRMVNFSINKFLKLYNDDIINYSYKYNLDSIDNEGTLIILHNLFYEHNINYVNVDKLDLSNNQINNSVKKLIKECCLTYKKNQVTKIKMFIDKNKYIIKRASRNFNRINNNNIEIINNNNFSMEIDFEEGESLSWTTEEEIVELTIEDVCNELENLYTN
jgi:hypothetical protein